MFSRIITTAKKYLYIPPESQEAPESNLNTATPDQSSMGASQEARKRKQIPVEDDDEEEDTINVYVPTPKRKSREISRDEQIPDSGNDDEPIEVSSKRRRIDKKGATKKENELVIRNTRPVVEIPVMSSSPVVKSRSPRSPPKKVHKPEIVEISDDEEVEEAEVEEVAEEKVEEKEEEEEELEEKTEEEAKLEVEQPIESPMDQPSDPEPGQENRLNNQNETTKMTREGTAKRKGDVLAELPIPRSRAIPDLLPMELLEDDEPAATTTIQNFQQMRPKKTKFADLVEPPPKDRRMGSTTFRVSKKSDSKLAPKASHRARSTKEAWLQGRAGKTVGANRKPFSKGFFVSKK
ncbi:hypothetical protein G7Y89_g5422 [Cudoniella acicularis]|uniref:Uncharacterized protein n=1 Tax=Cudoniella acicularis TaxID=354080 RepID=A0A8H4W408_9HELO|nr:hypothetical protein G7Y89_g5422 [Cudoniella acicularis]